MEKQIVRDALNLFNTKYSPRFFLDARNDLAATFDGDVLRVAEAFRGALEKETAEYGICGMTVQNASGSTFRKCTAPTFKCKENPCSRCGGTGAMPFRHIHGGVCFKCNGTGVNTK